MGSEDGSGSQLPINSSAGYTFPVKLGDAERAFDGLVGYFPLTGAGLAAGGPTSQIPPPVPAKGAKGMVQSDLDLGTLYTFFTETLPPAANKQSDPRVALSLPPPANNPSAPVIPVTSLLLTPYYIRSDSVTSLPPSFFTSQTARTSEPPALTQHDATLAVFGMITDPFLSVHAYSAILPNLPLQLPTWAVETALQQMTAFWRAGPLVVTSNPLGGRPSATQKIGIPLAAPAASASGQGATYNWLQPSWVSLEVDTPAADGSGAVLKTTTMTTKFQGVDVAPFQPVGEMQALCSWLRGHILQWRFMFKF
jgi:hypothetical protein